MKSEMTPAFSDCESFLLSEKQCHRSLGFVFYVLSAGLAPLIKNILIMNLLPLGPKATATPEVERGHR